MKALTIFQVNYFNYQIYREQKIFLHDSLKLFCIVKRNIATKCFMLVQKEATKTLCDDMFVFRVKLFHKK